MPKGRPALEPGHHGGMDKVEVSGTLPSDGRPFRAVVSRDVIALRIGDSVCLAAPWWLTDEQRHRAIEALGQLDA